MLRSSSLNMKTFTYLERKDTEEKIMESAKAIVKHIRTLTGVEVKRLDLLFL